MTDPGPFGRDPELARCLGRYADLTLEVGLGLQPGRRLQIAGHYAGVTLEAAPLVRELAERAYGRGVRHVAVYWRDDATTRARLERAPLEALREGFDWETATFNEPTGPDDAFLMLEPGGEAAFAGIPSERLSALKVGFRGAVGVNLRQRATGVVPWCIAAAPTVGWARAVFPDEDDATALVRLWRAVFSATRSDLDDPVAAWRRHLGELAAQAHALTARRYRAVRFRGPGTELEVGLADGHVWAGGASKTKSGTTYVANLPTEEVYTMPHRERVNGRVRGTKPVLVSGTRVEGVQLEFRDGRCVAASAERGEDALNRLLAADPGARYLGEVALAAADSAVARLGPLFEHTLYDENAACHIALGSSYPMTLEGGTELTPDELRARGANTSSTHDDVMIGSEEVDVDGIRADGDAEALLRGGRFVVSAP